LTGALPPATGCGPDFTPQGFLVEADESGGWKSVLVARSTLAPGGAEPRLIGFGAPGPGLLAMLGRNELFGVIADPGPLGIQTPGELGSGGPVFANGLWLGPWPLSIAVGEDDPEGPANVLLLKYVDGALTDRLADPSSWVTPDALDDDARSSLLQWIGGYLDSARKKAVDDQLYRSFAESIDDPDWKGLLVLRPTIDLRSLPGELAAFPSWPGADRLHAHHAAVRYGDPRYPAVFGVIDCQPIPAGAAGGAGGLSLLSLRARIEYSGQVEFDCRVAASPAGEGAEAAVMAGRFAFEAGKRRFDFTCAEASSPLDRPGDAPRPLEDWFGRIEPVLNGWLGPTGNLAGTIGIRVGYEYRPAPASDLWTSLPVLMAGPSPVADAANLLASAGREAAAWLEETAPSGAEARFSLAATVLSDPSGDGTMRVTLPAFTVAVERVAAE